jgi:adenylosuccinate lyase
LSLPESFLALDGALDLMHNVASGLVVFENLIARNLDAELPFLATENMLMAAVQAGADRQDAHERIRAHAQAAGDAVKREGKPNDLIDRLRGDAMFTNLDFDALMDARRYIGRAPQQVDEFIERVVKPIRSRYADHLSPPREPHV